MVVARACRYVRGKVRSKVAPDHATS